MTKQQIEELIINIVQELMEDEEDFPKISSDTSLIGNSGILDSMKLVELSLSLEDKASEIGFEFDWTSKNAMSKSKSFFRTVETLGIEFSKQLNKKNDSVITGANRGLGKSIAERLHSKKKNVFGISKILKKSFDGMKCDISSYEEIKAIQKSLKERKSQN